MDVILRLVRGLVGMVADAALSLALSLLAVLGGIALMVTATVWFGITGLIVAAVPIIGGLFVWSYLHAGSDGDSDGD